MGHYFLDRRYIKNCMYVYLYCLFWQVRPDLNPRRLICLNNVFCNLTWIWVHIFLEGRIRICTFTRNSDSEPNSPKDRYPTPPRRSDNALWDYSNLRYNLNLKYTECNMKGYNTGSFRQNSQTSSFSSNPV